MRRSLGYLSFALAAGLVLTALGVRRFGLPTLDPGPTAVVVSVLQVGAILVGAYGLYLLTSRVLVSQTPDKRRQHDVRNGLRFLFVTAAIIAALGVITNQWVGVLVSLGIVGFAVTFALQQPLFSLIGWFYIMVKRPYQVGDRVKIDDSKGDVVEVDFFVTTLWEINGDLVSSHQPSGRIVTLPNSVVLSSHVYNYSWEGFPYVWNELGVQVSYETDLQFTRELLVDVANEYLGDEMAEHVADYRRRLDETPVELEVEERPTVNVHQRESWIEFRLRYLVHPRRGARTRNELYTRIIDRLNEHPDRVSFPVSRNR